MLWKLLTIFGRMLPGLYLPADEPNDDDPGQDDSDDNEGGDEPTEAEKHALALAEENKRLKEEARKRKSEQRKAESAKRTKKAIEDGKLQDELASREAELEAARERTEKLEQAMRDRVERQIAKLPKDVQEEIALVKDDLALEKLEALVEKRGAGLQRTKDDPAPKGGTPPPTVGSGGDNPKPKAGDHEIHADTKGIMTRLYAKSRQFEVAKGLGVSSDGKFGWGRSDDPHETTANFIDLLDRIKARPVGVPDEDSLVSRVRGKK